jgi:hypothetical protein
VRKHSITFFLNHHTSIGDGFAGEFLSKCSIRSMLGGMPAITGVPETCKSIIKARIFQKKNYTAYNKDTTGVPETCKSNIKARIFQKEKKIHSIQSRHHTSNAQTFIEEASNCGLNASKGRFPKARKILSPSALASILKPLSAVVTARRLPSLLNFRRGRA